MITDTRSPQDLTAGAVVHPGCFVCSRSNPRGLHVRFAPDEDGVRGEFACDRSFEGYPGVIHGGIVTALLDEAMLHCLLARNLPAVTVDLAVQFRHPVETEVLATVRARIADGAAPLYHLVAELRQAGQLKARARGHFMLKPPNTSPDRGRY